MCVSHIVSQHITAKNSKPQQTNFYCGVKRAILFVKLAAQFANRISQKWSTPTAKIAKTYRLYCLTCCPICNKIHWNGQLPLQKLSKFNYLNVEMYSRYRSEHLPIFLKITSTFYIFTAYFVLLYCPFFTAIFGNLLPILLLCGHWVTARQRPFAARFVTIYFQFWPNYRQKRNEPISLEVSVLVLIILNAIRIIDTLETLIRVEISEIFGLKQKNDFEKDCIVAWLCSKIRKKIELKNVRINPKIGIFIDKISFCSWWYIHLKRLTSSNESNIFQINR